MTLQAMPVELERRPDLYPTQAAQLLAAERRALLAANELAAAIDQIVSESARQEGHQLISG